MPRHHRIDNHPLFIAGLDAVNRALPNSIKKSENLIRKWRLFSVWAIKQNCTEIKSVTRDLVILYGQHLKTQFVKGEFASTTTATSYLYGVNKVLFFATNELWETVKPVRDCGIDQHSYIPNKTPTLTTEGMPDLNSLVSYLLELQTSLGLPITEACRLNLNTALKEGRKTGFITTYSQSSGVRRRVPCRSVAITAIGRGIVAKRHERLLPEPLTYSHIVVLHKKIAAKKGFSTNSGRSVYVQARYSEITGFEPPIKSGLGNKEHIQRLSECLGISEKETRQIDKSARITIVRELGELGIETLTGYLDQKGGL
jgi:hypothetical protein